MMSGETGLLVLQILAVNFLLLVVLWCLYEWHEPKPPRHFG